MSIQVTMSVSWAVRTRESDVIASFKRRKARYGYIKRYRFKIMGTMALCNGHDSRDTDTPFSQKEVTTYRMSFIAP